jgi:hypothetical protein
MTKPRLDPARSFALFGAALLIVAAWQTLIAGFAELGADQVESDLVAWHQRANTTGLPPAVREWQASMDGIERAIARDGSNPRFHELRGNLLTQIVSTGEGVTSWLPESIASFERAVALRPTSPYAWALLADARYRNGKVDAAFFHALEKAVEFGPGERESLLTVVDLGLAVLDSAPESTRRRILEAVQHADRRESRDVAAIAARRAKLEQVCKLANTSKTAACQAAMRPQ